MSLPPAAMSMIEATALVVAAWSFAKAIVPALVRVALAGIFRRVVSLPRSSRRMVQPLPTLLASVALPYWMRAVPEPPVSASEPWCSSGGVPVNVPPVAFSRSVDWLKVVSPLLVNVPAVCSNVEPSPLSNRNSVPDATVMAPALVHFTAWDKLTDRQPAVDLERAAGGVVDVAVDQHAAAVGLRGAQDAAVGELLAGGDRQERLVVLVAGRGELDQARVVDVPEAGLGRLEARIGPEPQRPLDRELVGGRDARLGEDDRRGRRDAGVLRAGRGRSRRPVGVESATRRSCWPYRCSGSCRRRRRCRVRPGRGRARPYLPPGKQFSSRRCEPR